MLYIQYIPVWDGLPERYWWFERLSLTLNHSTVLQILIPVALDLGREGGGEGGREGEREGGKEREGGRDKNCNSKGSHSRITHPKN